MAGYHLLRSLVHLLFADGAVFGSNQEINQSLTTFIVCVVATSIQIGVGNGFHSVHHSLLLFRTILDTARLQMVKHATDEQAVVLVSMFPVVYILGVNEVKALQRLNSKRSTHANTLLVFLRLVVKYFWFWIRIPLAKSCNLIWGMCLYTNPCLILISSLSYNL